MLRLRRALLLRAAAKDINLMSGGSAHVCAAALAVRAASDWHSVLLISNLPPPSPHALDLSVARALCARLRSSSARAVSGTCTSGVRH